MEIGRSQQRAINAPQAPVGGRGASGAARDDTAVRPAAVDAFDRTASTRPAVAAGPAPVFSPPTSGVWTYDTRTGQQSDPVTLYVHGNLSDVEATLAKAGWTKADPQGWNASIHYVGAALKQEALNAITWAANKLHGIEIGLAGAFGIHLPPIAPITPPHVAEVDRMPVSGQKLDGTPFVSAWECNNNPLGGRDHVRIFDTGQKDAQGLPVYGVSPILDTGIRFAKDHPESGFMFHTVAPDAGPERDKFLKLLTTFGSVSDLKKLSLQYGGPSALGERVPDSTAYELTLRAPRAVKAQPPPGDWLLSA